MQAPTAAGDTAEEQTQDRTITREYVELVRARVADRNIPCTDQHILECLKYLAILSLTQGRRIAVTPEVDEVWHELIVQTKGYKQLCDDLPGRRFIHHESIMPKEYAVKVGNDEFVEEFMRWIPDYIHNFGPFTPQSAQHWTIANFLQDVVGLSLDEINEAGRSATPEVQIPDDSPWKRLTQECLDIIAPQ